MMWKSLLKVAAAVLAATLLATGAGAVVLQAASEPNSAPDSGTRVAQAPPAAEAPKSEAQKIAEKILKAGSDLFDAKNARALAATYTEDGEVILVSKKDGEVNYDYKQGRNEIEAFYRDHFQRTETIDSENFVEYARLISADVLVIHGKFRPNANEAMYPFVQLRIKQGDRWLLSKLWLFISPGA